MRYSTNEPLAVDLRTQISEKRKLDLETIKLDLETKQLNWQISWQGYLLEILKATTVIAALIGVGVTFYFNTQLYRTLEENKLSERYSETLARLSGKEVRERLAGVLGIRPFLISGDMERKVITAQMLIRILSEEKDQHVRATILEVFSAQEIKTAGPDTINSALATAVERNRQITRAVVENGTSVLQELLRKKISESGKIQIDPRQLVRDDDLDALSFEDLLETHSYSRWPFDYFKGEDIAILEDISRAITKLVTIGAKIDNMSDIYCEKCDFTSAVDLANVYFERSYLGGANFTRANLRGAHFRDADLRGAIFFDSNLNGADLSRSPQRVIPTKKNPELPIFECANLIGAKLDNALIVAVEQKYLKPPHSSTLHTPKVVYALFNARTTFAPLGIALTRAYNERYLEDAPPKDPVKEHLRGQAGRERNLLPDAINQGSFVSTLDYFNVRQDVGNRMGNAGRKRDVGYV